MKQIVIVENVSHVLPLQQTLTTISYETSDGKLRFATKQQCVNYEIDLSHWRSYYRNHFLPLFGISALVNKYGLLKMERYKWEAAGNNDYVSYVCCVSAIEQILKERGYL